MLKGYWIAHLTITDPEMQKKYVAADKIAFGRIRFGLASSYSVILFIVMMAMGYFYVRALTHGDDSRAR